MAANSIGDRDTAPRLSWSPPQIPVQNGNDENDPNNGESLDTSYIGDRFRESQHTVYPDTPNLDDSQRGQPPRKKRHLEASDVDSNQDEQGPSKGPYFDAIRNTYTSSSLPVSLSQETLRALDSKNGESSTRVQGWLQGPTQFSVDVQRRKKHSVEYLLQEEDEPIPMATLPQPQRQVDRFECQNCKRSFNTKSELRHHARRYEKRPYNCDQCDRSFLYPKDLRRHKTTHTGSKQYRCGSCPKAFSRKDNLRRHMSNEHGNEEGPYDEVIDNSGGRRNREPDEDSEDRFDSQNNQQNSLSFGARPDATQQSGSEEQSGSAQIEQTGNGSDGRQNQDEDVSTKSEQRSALQSSTTSISHERAQKQDISIHSLADDVSSIDSSSSEFGLHSDDGDDQDPSPWSETENYGRIKRPWNPRVIFSESIRREWEKFDLTPPQYEPKEWIKVSLAPAPTEERDWTKVGPTRYHTALEQQKEAALRRRLTEPEKMIAAQWSAEAQKRRNEEKLKYQELFAAYEQRSNERRRMRRQAQEIWVPDPHNPGSLRRIDARGHDEEPKQSSKRETKAPWDIDIETTYLSKYEFTLGRETQLK